MTRQHTADEPVTETADDLIKALGTERASDQAYGAHKENERLGLPGAAAFWLRVYESIETAA